jgi:hypothetical protein
MLHSSVKISFLTFFPFVNVLQQLTFFHMHFCENCIRILFILYATFTRILKFCRTHVSYEIEKKKRHHWQEIQYNCILLRRLKHEGKKMYKFCNTWAESAALPWLNVFDQICKYPIHVTVLQYVKDIGWNKIFNPLWYWGRGLLVPLFLKAK